MPQDENLNKLFNLGTTWVRADFHLHTKADKEFVYTGDENSYTKEYIDALRTQGIRIGVISNHNKFNIEEFKVLRNKARKEEIFLLPGVELSVNDGANGIHTIIVFSDDWIANGQDFINQFLNVAFEGKTPSQYEQENCRCSLDLIRTIQKLEMSQKDFFIIFAHVEQNSGLLNELNGGRLIEFGKNPLFRKWVLGFQKMRTRDLRDKVKNWFDDWYPAEVEGSDCKSINSIGNGDSCYLKLGTYSFEATKFALVDKEYRVSVSPVEYKHSRIKKLRFIGGTLAGQEIEFSSELNTLIGIRGSGKSSIVEAIRYVLGIPVGEKSGDRRYKDELLKYTLGSGGKVELDVVDRHDITYQISRVFNEESTVESKGEHLQGVAIRETILRNPLYFGQKDLCSSGEGFEKDIVNKLLGTKRDEILQQISLQKSKVLEAIRNFEIGLSLDELIDEQNKIKQDADYQLRFYAEHKIQEKLQKRLDYDNDVNYVNRVIKVVSQFPNDISQIVSIYDDKLKQFKDYESKHNKELIQELMTILETNYLSLISKFKDWINGVPAVNAQLTSIQDKINSIRKGMVDEFAQIERELSVELKDLKVTNISSSEFLALNQKSISAQTRIEELQKQKTEFKQNQEILLKELDSLNDLWHKEFLLIITELEKIMKQSSAISIDSFYKADKSNYLNTMKEYCKGSNIREATLQGIIDQYPDFVSIFKDLDNAKKYFGSNPQVYIDYLFKNLGAALTYQVPNKFIIKYRDKELQHHSLGQRASALILFVLSLRENDVIIIDQPEDDLDNQTIYEDVIKLIKRMKTDVQFIFATHNPNIPVLGDAELVHACSFMDERISIQSGSIDKHEIQKTIVRIMEGGQEAFNRRKEIYESWKS